MDFHFEIKFELEENYMDQFNEFGMYNNAVSADAIKARNEALAQQTVIKTYLLMFLVTLVSGASAVISYTSGAFEAIAMSGTWWIFCIIELAVVFICTRAAVKDNTILAGIMLLIYSVVNGITLASIFYTYDLSSILLMFFIASAMFGSLAIYGSITKKDLSTVGKIGYMGLIGVILLTVCNIFFMKSSGLDLALCVVGLALFIGITAYDAQMIKDLAYERDNQSSNSIAVVGALNLYLDFINIFLYLLEIFGDD